MLFADTLRSLGGALALAALIAPLALSAQNRDFGAERVNLDDAAGDGGFNTATLQVPPSGLSANRTITFPDVDGTVGVAAAPLTASQILFGGASGEMAQSASLTFTTGTGMFNIGGGGFTVDAGNGATNIASSIAGVALTTNNTAGGTALSARNSGGNATFTARNNGSGLSALIDRFTNTTLPVAIVRSDNAGSSGNGLQVENNGSGDGLQVDQTGTGIGVQINGNATGLALEVNGDADITGSLSVGTLMLNGDLDMDDNDILNIDELRGNSATGDLNVNTTNTGDINLGNGTGDVNADANVLPAVDDTYDLGSPTLRWQDIYLGPATIHIGSNADEAEISFVGGNLEFDGDDDALVDMSISGTTGEVTIENELRVNDNLIVTGGDIDTDQDVVAGGDITAGNEIEADGAILGNAAGNEFGDGNDALQLTVDGVDGGAIELQVNGDADVTGSLSVGTVTDGTASMTGGVLTTGAPGSVIGDGTDALQLNVAGLAGGAVDARVTGDLDVTGTLTTTGFSSGGGGFTLNGDLDVNGNDILDGTDGDVTIVDDLVVTGDVLPAATLTHSLGSDALRWNDAYVGPASLHVGPTGGEGAGTEMVLGFVGGNTGTINVNGAGFAQFAINGGTNVVVVNADGAGAAEIAVDRNGANEIVTLNPDGGGAAEVVVNAATDIVAIDPDGDGTAEVVVNAGAGEVNVNDDLNIAGNVVVTGGDIDTDQDVVAGGNITAGGDLQADGEFVLGTGDAGDIMTIDNGAGTDLEMGESGIDRSSGAAETFDIDNSGAGDITVRVNGAGTVTNSRLTINDGHWTSQQATAPVSAVAGANVTSAVLANETDVAGSIDIMTSGTPADGAQATVTFDAAYGTAPIVVLTAANGAGTGIGAYVTRTTTTFTISFIGVPAASTSYQFYYQVIETQ